MNKIVTINIGGIAISIEEDAFDALRDYLKNIGNHFKNTENGDEIIADIELRVGEMLQSKLTESKVSVNLSDVENVAQTMGYPSDFEAEEEVNHGTSETSAKDEKQANEPKEKSSSRKTRRLFRDVDNQQIGGVCAGFAKYFNLDPTVLRILWVVSLLVFGFGFWIYIILWAILPAAKTTADKLEMMGESPNIENIKNTIHNEAKSAYERITTPENRRTVSHFFDSVIQFLKRVFGVFFKIFAIIAFVGIIILLISSLMGIMFNGHFFNLDSNIRIDGQVLNLMVVGAGSWFFKIAFYLIFAIPLVYIASHILPEVLSVPKPTKPVKQSMISGWFIAIILAVVGFFYSARQYQSEGIATSIEQLDVGSDTLIIRVDDMLAEDFTKTKRNLKLDVIQSDGKVEIKIQKSARARNEDAAKESTENIANAFRLSKNTLLLSEKVLLTNDGRVVSPDLTLTVRVPIGQTVIFHESTKRVIHDIKNLQNVFDPEMAGHVFYMSEAGFRCEDCKVYKSNSNTENLDAGFNKMEIEGALKVKIIEGSDQKIDIPQRKDDKKWVEFSITDNTLRLKQKRGISIDDREITVWVPQIKEIELGGSCELVMESNSTKKDYFDLQLNGASSASIFGLLSNKLAMELDGASKAIVSGTADLVLLDISGAGSLDGSALTAENANIDMGGASHATMVITSELSGDLGGAAKFRYGGDPTVKVDRSAGASLKPIN
ncbi:MAG: phage shock protein PspC (stress-responsive transcriptional regulator) [Bacteroidia bacterium]|jgi:phage shock protein PspC (stress-responsive transcriptional regulator)